MSVPDRSDHISPQMLRPVDISIDRIHRAHIALAGFEQAVSISRRVYIPHIQPHGNDTQSSQPCAVPAGGDYAYHGTLGVWAGLVKKLENIIRMLSLKQKGKFYFRTLRFEDALHFGTRIPDRHIACTASWCTVRWRGTNASQQFLRIGSKTQAAKVSWECYPI